MFDCHRYSVAQAEAGKSGQQIAAETGLDPSTLSRIKLGQVEPRPPTVKKLADALGIPVADLLKDPNNEPVAS